MDDEFKPTAKGKALDKKISEVEQTKKNNDSSLPSKTQYSSMEFESLFLKNKEDKASIPPFVKYSRL